MSLLNLHIDGREIQAEEGQTILEAAAANNIYIPSLCHDPRIKTYGACGVCVVENESSPRLLRACSTLAVSGMVIKTDTERVRNTRKTALELLLSDHKGDCRPPCVLACPAQTDCQGYVGLIANGQFKEAAELIREKLPLPASIGRVCPHPCETACRRELVEEPVSIASLKYFVTDKFTGEDEIAPKAAPETGKSAAIIGGGPGGLTAAYFLRRLGHSVTIYDSMPKMGGMLRYGIPEYRLPKKVLDREISIISKMGVSFSNNIRVGADITLDSLRAKHNAVVVALGAWTSMKLNCSGENLGGVFGGIDFLRNIALNNPPRIGDRVAVVGGGNTAMDACRSAVRLGAKEVYIIYRRTRDEMPAEAVEIDEAGEEGVVFKYLTNPIEITGDKGQVSGIRLQKMKLGEPDSSGRRSPVPVEGDEETIALDSVIIAIGQSVQAAGFEGVSLTRRGTIAADETTFRTSLDGVFAVGDATNKGADIAISAVAEAGKAVPVIDAYLNGQSISYTAPFLVETKPGANDFADREKTPRAVMRHLSPEERRCNFKEINFGFSDEEAVQEASRCLECGCADYFECRLIKIANEYCVQPGKYSGEKIIHHVNNEHPYINRNPDKCILCGLCVRICDEVMGISALGLIDRGFNSVVKPAFDAALDSSGCISCGQCVSVCPTGALTEKIIGYKPVPLEETAVPAVCSSCSVGCKMTLMTKGNMILRSLPDTGADPQAVLCVKGRFAFTETVKIPRITKPLIRNSEADIHTAAAYVAKKIREIISKYGASAAAVSIPGDFTNEEIRLAKEYAASLGVDVFSFDRKKSGLLESIGSDASTAGFDDLANADLILLAAGDIMDSHPSAGVMIRRAVQRGAKLILVNDGTVGLADEWCDIKLTSLSDLRFLKQHIDGEVPAGQKTGAGDIHKAAELLRGAEKAVAVFDQDSTTEEDQALLGKIFAPGGRYAKPGCGIIQLKARANSQGLADLGIRYSGEITESAAHKTLKGLIAFSGDTGGADLSGLEFLCVADTIMGALAKQAETVLPRAGFAESGGSYTNAVGEINKFTAAVSPLPGFTNSGLIQSLIDAAAR